MPTLYNQSIAHRFGVELIEELHSSEWTTFEFAVAWAPRSGVRHLQDALRRFLRAGGTMKGTVGVDLENTSYEGLADLLAVCGEGNGEIFIYQNEADTTFHPKVYLFSNGRTARLMVGSNNFTGAGLYTNTEVSLAIDGRFRDKVILDARAALQSWRDVTTDLTRLLDRALLADLLSEGYVQNEARLRERVEASKRAAQPAGRTRRRLFGTKAITRPRPPIGAPGPTSTRTRRVGRKSSKHRAGRRRVPGGTLPNTLANVLLMRVRRASETGRRTQIQLPIRKMQAFFGGDFFDQITAITNANTGEQHDFVYAYVREVLNTIKVEVPEIDRLADPVMRLERTATGVVYEVYDRSSPNGRQIMNAIEAGLQTDPQETMLTISDTSRATMARFV